MTGTGTGLPRPIRDLSARLRIASGVERDIPWTEVERLELRAGTRSYAKTGAIVGGLTCGAAGLFLGSAVAADDFFDASAGEVALITGVGLAGGAAAGALIGMLFRSDRWIDVPPGTVALRPFAGGGTVGLRLVR